MSIDSLRMEWNRATWAALQFKGTPEAEKLAFLAELAGNEYVAALVASWGANEVMCVLCDQSKPFGGHLHIGPACAECLVEMANAGEP